MSKFKKRNGNTHDHKNEAAQSRSCKEDGQGRRFSQTRGEGQAG